MCVQEASCHITKGLDIMNTAAKLRDDEYAFATEFEAYIESLIRKRDQSREEFANESRTALVRTGVLNDDGKAKDKIVTWE